MSSNGSPNDVDDQADEQGLLDEILCLSIDEPALFYRLMKKLSDLKCLIQRHSVYVSHAVYQCAVRCIINKLDALCTKHGDAFLDRHGKSLRDEDRTIMPECFSSSIRAGSPEVMMYLFQTTTSMPTSTDLIGYLLSAMLYNSTSIFLFLLEYYENEIEFSGRAVVFHKALSNKNTEFALLLILSLSDGFYENSLLSFEHPNKLPDSAFFQELSQKRVDFLVFFCQNEENIKHIARVCLNENRELKFLDLFEGSGFVEDILFEAVYQRIDNIVDAGENETERMKLARITRPSLHVFVLCLLVRMVFSFEFDKFMYL